MRKKEDHIIALLMGIFLFSCHHRNFYEKNYYNTGELMSMGWYCADNVPVDTLFQYYKNGQLSAISVYDSNCTGKLNGVTAFFYRNGNIAETFTYDYGEVHGPATRYACSGKLWNRYLNLHNVVAGDYYEYDTTAGYLSSYTFFLGPEKPVGRIEYDNNRNIIRQSGETNAVIRYRTVEQKDSSGDKCFVEMLNSNPPWRRTVITVNLYAGDSIILKDSIVNIPFFRKTYSVDRPVTAAFYNVVQYDSITGNYYYFNTGKPRLKHYYGDP